MTRCSYIPPEGQSVIAIAKERGGTTDGDIQALVDRFGCKAEARWEVTAEAIGGPWKEPACSDHVGHLLHDGANDVRPIEVSGVTIDIVHTDAAPAAGFGPAIILSQSPGAPPVVDLGENPTREQIRAAGFGPHESEYSEALQRLREIKALSRPVRIETNPGEARAASARQLTPATESRPTGCSMAPGSAACAPTAGSSTSRRRK